MSPPILQIRNLSVEFPGMVRTVKAVRGIDLDVERGAVMGLVGESGSGKSMTAMACLGLIPKPGRVSGSIEVDGFEVVGKSEQALGRLRGGEVAMIFQNPMKALNPFFSVGDQMLDVIGYHRALDKKGVRAAAIESLHAVQLPDAALMLERYPHQLSGGQVQRVMIAVALVCQPKLIVADEPTTALDVTVQAQIISLLRELARERDRTILFITHDLSVVASLCDSVAVMYAGEIVELGPVGSVFSNPRHPYTTKLMGTVPRLGGKDQELRFIPGQVPDMSAPPSGCAFHPRCELARDVCSSTPPDFQVFDGPRKAACHFAAGSPCGRARR